MGYDVQYSDKADKELAKTDHFQARIIIAWVEKNLVGCANPRLHGMALVGSDYWRYRVGDYRLIADIQDNLVLIEIVRVGHRRDVYDD